MAPGQSVKICYRVFIAKVEQVFLHTEISHVNCVVGEMTHKIVKVHFMTQN